MKKLVLISILFIAGLATTCAQTVPDAGVTITNAIPPSPDAAALGKYGSLPVGAFTGVPKIDIPIYTIKSGDLTLPVSISYHSGGNKVEEMASSVGLGWSLNAGGAIVRTVRGLPDEAINGILSPPYNIPLVDSLVRVTAGANYTAAQLATINTTLNYMATGVYDSEADVYNFNFGNYSGKFVMDSYGNVYVLPRQKIKFTFKIALKNTTEAYIQSFTAITPDGVTYIFGSDNDGNDAVEFTNTNTTSSTGGGVVNKQKIATSWFIKRMISPDGHQINFTYKSEEILNQQTISASNFIFLQCNNCGSYLGNPGPATDSENLSSANTIYTVKLTNISFENGNLNVTSNTSRLDNPGSAGTAVDAINITNVSGSLNKVFNFYYYNTSSTRLRLDSLIETVPANCPNCNPRKKYSFTYNVDQWSRTSTNTYWDLEQDYWGYYNGMGNTNLVPTVTYNGTLYPGANRTPNEQAMLGGMLTQIKYPTGGYTNFTYEANTEASSGEDFGGLSNAYPPVQHLAAICNDPGNYLYNYDINNGNPNDSIKIVSAGGPVPVTVTASGLNNPPSVVLGIDLFQVTSTGTMIIAALKNDTVLYLNPGNYKLNLFEKNNVAYSPSFPTGIKYSLLVQWTTPNPALLGTSGGSSYVTQIVGGLRIKQIADYDGINPNPFNTKTYQYTEPGSTKSSGNLNGDPTYTYLLNKDIEAPQAQYSGIFVWTYQGLECTAVSNIPLGTSQGSVVGYTHVQEFIGGSGQNGMNEYFYSFVPDLVSPPGAFPITPSVDQSWKRGLLKKEINYKQTAPNTYVRVQEKINAYGSGNSYTPISLKVGFSEVPSPGTFDPSYNYYEGLQNFVTGGKLQFQIYYNYTDFTYLLSDTTKVYNMSDTTKYVQTYNTYAYDTTSFQLSQRTSVNSKSELITENILYPDNYNITGSPTNSALAGILNLQNINMLDVPIEETTQKSNFDGSNSRVVKSVLTTYKPGQPLRDSVFEMRSVTPLTTFTASTAGANSLIKDSHYQPVVAFNQYDAYGNILQENKVADALHTYIWGYLNINPPYYNTYPIAAVINADSTSIAYTNFESYSSVGYGNWVYTTTGATTDATAPMGAQCYNTASGAITKSALNSSNSYVVSFWAKQGAAVIVSGGTVTATTQSITLNGWSYNEYKVTGAATITIGGSGYIDELRLYPSTAQMSTYTYIPLVGISASCNAKNQFSYYQYDSVGRLVNITDQYGNIIKNYQYNYRAQ